MDIVMRLRTWAGDGWENYEGVMAAAADEIEYLRRIHDDLRQETTNSREVG